MTYFTEKEWWDPKYKIRRSVAFTPLDLLPGSETLCAVKLKKANLNNKIKSDYSDLAVMYQPSGNHAYMVPYYIVNEGDYISVVFESFHAVVYNFPATPDLATPYYFSPIYVTQATPVESTTPSLLFLAEELPVGESEDEYYIYYAGKTKAKLDFMDGFLQQDYLTKYDFGQLDSNTRWTFQKPSLYWSQNAASEYGAQATFEFIGHRADFHFYTGPNYGKFEYQIGTGEWTTVDCYSGTESIQRMIEVQTNKVDTTKVRIRVLGSRNQASASNRIKLYRTDYHQILVGVPENEEFYSDTGKALTTGS